MIDLNDNWTLTPGLNYQTAEAEGSWFHNPKFVGDLQVARFFPDWQDEDWYQASLTLDGNIGDLNLVYAGAYLDRDVDSSYDYTVYSEYRSDYYAYYEYACYVYDPNGDCADPSQFTTGDENFTRQSHEIRLQSAQDQRLRWIAGLFYQRQEHFFDLQWNIPTLDESLSVVPNNTVVWQTQSEARRPGRGPVRRGLFRPQRHGHADRRHALVRIREFALRLQRLAGLLHRLFR